MTKNTRDVLSELLHLIAFLALLAVLVLLFAGCGTQVGNSPEEIKHRRQMQGLDS
jgi:ACR3 family arsenite efflux pump ArsB